MRNRPMIVCTVLLLAAAAFVPGCGGSEDGDGDGSNQTFRPTTWHGFRTNSTAMQGTFPIFSNDDLTLYQSQTGVTQNAGNGLLILSIDNAVGDGVAGAQVQVLNEAGLSAGTPFYRNASFQYSPFQLSTTANGDAIVFNVAPGRVNIRVTAGAVGNAYATSVADELTLVNMTVASLGTPGNATWTGATRAHTNAPGVAIASVTVTGIATGSPFPFTSNGTGNFGPLATPASQSYATRASVAGHHDTHNMFTLGTGVVGQDIFIVPETADTDTNFVPSDVTLTAGTSIVRGRVQPTGTTDDGFVLTVTDMSANAVGDVRYANASGVPQTAATTASQGGGIFYVYNLPAGATFLVRATKGGPPFFLGAAYVDTFAPVAPATRQVTFMPPVGATVSASGSPTIAISGSLVTFTGATPIGNATITRLGHGSTPTTEFGNFNMTGVPANSDFRIRSTKP